MSNEGALKDISKEMLEELYGGQRLSCFQIAELFGVTRSAVTYRMQKLSIPIRPQRLAAAEANKGHLAWNKGQTKETNPSLARLSQHLKGERSPNFGKFGLDHPTYGLRHTEEWKEQQSIRAKHFRHTDASRAKISQAHKISPPWNKGLTKESDNRLQKLSELLQIKELGDGNPFFGKHHTEEVKNFLREKGRREWQNPNYVARMMRSVHSKPNKAEQKLIDLLNEFFPQFQYNGDFSLGVIIGGVIPDYVNVDGQKQIIELFGKRWHNKENQPWHRSELGRVMLFNSLGYQCLVIWDRELKDMSQVIDKIKEFITPRRR